MSGIYFGEAVRLKSYGAISKGGNATIKIELVATNHYDTASILRQLDDVQREQAQPQQPAPKSGKGKKGAAVPVRLIEDMREDKP